MGEVEPPRRKPCFSKDYVNTEGALSHLREQQRYVIGVVSGQDLFYSTERYDNGTGRPSFTEPIDDGALDTRTHHQPTTPRSEVRSAGADSHLGHLFTDGPEDANGLRYCMNSAALRFVSASSLEEEGYGQYRSLFNSDAESTGDVA